jgi:HlyD family secretion protein
MEQNFRLEKSRSSRNIFRSPAFLAIIASLIVGGLSVYTVRRFQSNAVKEQQMQAAVAPVVTTVTALGRLEPKGEVIKLSAPTSNEGNRVDQLLVKEGDKVRFGQVIAIMDSRDRLLASLGEAQKQVQVAKARLEQVKAGAKQGEIGAQQANVNRFQAELEGDVKTQQAEIARLQAQLNGEIATQQATINRLEAELQGQQGVLRATVARVAAERRNAQADVKRYESLYKEGAISSQEYDRQRLLGETTNQQLIESQATQTRTIATLQQQINEAKANRDKTVATLQQQINEAQANRDKSVATLQQQINQAKATLDQTAEVRPVDVQTAQAEVDSALATVEKVKAQLAQAYVRAPRTGRILEINTRSGETVGDQGIVDLGQTDQMYAVVEVYQSDINKVRPGQRVRISSETLPEELLGRVDWTGLQIKRQNVINTDPSSNIDARVVEVHVRLDEPSSEKSAKLTNLQVQAVIEL